MTETRALPLRLARRWWTWLIVGLLLLLGAMVGERVTDLGKTERTAIPIPSPVYTIEAKSGAYTASILNLGIQPVGVPQVPIPVDVNGDLIPDVTVGVNLLNIPQGIHNPLNLSNLIAPNVEINRFPLEIGTTILGLPSPPLKINVRFDIFDLEGQEDTMHVRFGYDTGLGGSIPGFFQATLRGLTDFFNPLSADISTKGDIIGFSPDPIFYEGPLTVIGGFEQGPLKADLGLEFAPFPDQVGVTFEQDGEGAHIGYAHGSQKDVDLDASVDLTSSGELTEVDAHIERLPHELGVGIADDPNGGGITFDAKSDGRLADIDVRFRGPLAGERFDAHLAIEELPSHMEAAWSMPPDGSVEASFDSSGQGIGAIEALITNKNGNPTGLPAFAFAEQQVLAVHHNAETDGLRVGGRLERIRSAHVTSTPEGVVDADVNIGDGELPLEIDGWLDLRDDDLPLIEANAVLSPLPGAIGVSIDPGESTEADPMRIVYETAESPDIDGNVKLQDPAAETDACGDAGIICAGLRLRHVPTRVETRIFEALDGDKRESHIEVDAEAPEKPDLFADVILGPDVDDEDGKPLVAHAEVLAITEIARIRTVEGKDDTLERADFHTCDFDYENDECIDGTEDRIGRLDFRFSNFLPDLRPDDLPPAYAATPNFTTIVARGRDSGNSIDFEATGRLSNIKEVTYVNNGAFGVRTNVGGGGDLAAIVDIDDIRFEDEGAQTKFYDITGDILISPLPETMAFCLNASGQEIVDPTSTITTECQQGNPFDPEAADLAKSPLSVAYDGATPFNVTVDAELHELGLAGSNDRDDRRVRGHLGIENIPTKIRAHILDPDDVGGGPMLVTFDSPGATDQINLDVRAELLSADLQCQDPRVPDSGHTAICASGRIEHLPTHLEMEYDPARDADNFVLDTMGNGVDPWEPIDLPNIVVSSVQRDDDTDRAQVLIADVDILNLPKRVAGTLSLPAPEAEDDPIAVDLTATPPVGEIRGTVRNFIAPDPIPDMPPQRDGLPEPTDYASFIQRGDAFKASLLVTDIKRVGYKNQVTAAGERLDTSVINVDFGATKDIRAYADLNADGTEQLIGDVTLGDVASGLQVCFRGEKSAATIDKVAVNPVYCDTNPAPPADPDDPNPQLEQGAFELRMDDASSVEGATELDVDAFVRHATGGGADIIAGRLGIINIPNVIAGTFGDGKVDVGGFQLDGTPEGIDEIKVHAASFDIEDDGWLNNTDRPYDPRFVGRAPFVYTIPSIQHVLVRADDADFDLRARIGSGDNSQNASELHRVKLSDDPCKKPEPVDYENPDIPVPDYGPRPDFPHLPTEDGTTHTCVRVDFEPSGDSSVDPLDLSAVIEQGGQRIALHDAGLDDIPEFIQLNLADAEDGALQLSDPPMRPHCVGEGLTQPANCVAPMARFDTPGNSSLFGVVEIGAIDDVATLDGVIPREDIPQPVEPSGWVGENGVRARVGSFEDRSAVKVGLRIPIPASFTLDQVQTWGKSEATDVRFYDAADMHFRYAMRDKTGDTIANLGLFSALIHSFVDQSQIMISDDTVTQGFEVPGELGLNMYTRDYSGEGRSFMQIDGRNSAQDFDMRLRMLGGLSEDSFSRIDAQIRNVPALESLDYTTNTDPTFRLRTEIMGDKKNPPDPQSEDPSGGEPPKEKECSPLFCVYTQIRLESINAQFDFEPTPGSPARLLEAAIRTDGAKNGLEVRGWDDVNDGENAPDGKFLAGAELSIDPINIFIHAGIPLLASLDFVLMSDLDAAVSLGGDFDSFDGSITDLEDIEHAWGDIFNPDNYPPNLEGSGTSRFMLKQNLLKLYMENGGAPGDNFSRLGPVDFNVDIMHGSAWALFVKLIGIDFLPPFSTLRVPFLNCKVGGIIPGGFNSIDIPGGSPGGSKSVVAWPFFPFPVGNLHFSGVLAPLVNLVASFGGPFFCLVDHEQELMEVGGDKVHPADPLGPAFTGSTVPDAELNLTAVPDPPVGEPDDEVIPPFTATASVPWCGTHTFSDLTVNGGVTISAATSFSANDIRGVLDVADDDFPPACPNADGSTLGELQIVASGTVTVNGTISADGISTSTNAGNNGGGGNLAEFPSIFQPDNGNGGAGSFGGPGGVGSTPTADQLNDPLFARNGANGRSAGGGAGGTGAGIVKVLADTLVVNGRLSAEGQPGGTSVFGHCFIPDSNPDPDINNEQPNNGLPGGGGGAGGGLVISTADLQNNGVISARGGNGGGGRKGGGGGGGGGTLRIDTALSSGAAASNSQGSGGVSACPAEFSHGTAGVDGYDDITQAVRSKVDISTADDFSFWNSTADGVELEVPYQAAAQPSPDGKFNVVLCETYIDPDDIVSGQAAEDAGFDLARQMLNFPDGLVQPTLYEDVFGFLFPGDPCGAGVGNPDPDITGPTVLNDQTYVDDDRVSGIISAGTNLTEGYHGLYTIIWKSDVADNNCFDITDQPGFPFTDGAQYDFDHCYAETMPVSPDIVVGIDNQKPDVMDISVNGVSVTDGTGVPTGNEPVLTASPDLQVSFTDKDNLSQIVARQCTPDAGNQDRLVACASGDVVTVDGGNGTRTIGIRVTDAAGNTDQFTADVLLDTIIPASSGELVGGSATPGDNGWYLDSPSFRLFDFDDFGGTGPGSPPYKYQFDEGDVRPCDNAGTALAPECDIDGSVGHELPGIGHHELRWTAIDVVGNQLADEDRPVIPVKIDDEPPISDILSVPAAPNGANGWFSGATWVSFGAFDQPGGSGFEPNLLEAETDTGGIFYSHQGDPFTEFDPLDPLRLDPGENDVCWFARDIAGHQEATRCETYFVDEADPIADNVTTGGTLGVASWFTASPTLESDVVDFGVLGSGVAADLSPTDEVCGQRPIIADPAPSGTCISVDGAPFLPIDASTAQFVLGEGLHEVRLFSTDRAGRRSAIDTALYKVDLSEPVAAIRTITPEPSRGRWHRADATVVLRAADGDRHGSGVDEIRYRVTGGLADSCTPVEAGYDVYTKPFTLSQGVWTVRYWSVDEAGLVGDCKTQQVAVDKTPGVPKALTANPNLWLRVNLLGIIVLQPQTTQLRWTVQEGLSGSVGDKVHVDVIVYDILGQPTRRLNAGDHLVGPNQTLSGQVAWDGRPHNLLTVVPLGTYYYRVVVTDAAGNPAMSGESGALVVVRLL